MAVEKDDHIAQYMLGYIYYMGKNQEIIKNVKKAIHYLQAK